jgi:hypothetical protein
MYWFIIECIGYFIGLDFMCVGVVICVRCGGASGCVSLFTGFMLCSILMYLCLNVRDGQWFHPHI